MDEAIASTDTLEEEAFGAVVEEPDIVPGIAQLTPQEYRNRQALLNKVKNFWVQGVLETSLHHQVVIQLGLEDRSHVLATSWNLVVETADHTQTILSEGTTVLDLFDRLRRVCIKVQIHS